MRKAGIRKSRRLKARSLFWRRACRGRFNVVNTSNKKIENCSVWFRDGQGKNLYSFITFEVLEDIEDCRFFFLNVPHKNSRVHFAPKG